MIFIYTFNPQSNSWSIPKITAASGVTPTIKKDGLTGIIDHNGKMYLWGGQTSSVPIKLANDMLILDTINLIWGTGTSVGAPISRMTYGAVLLPNQSILYIGNS